MLTETGRELLDSIDPLLFAAVRRSQRAEAAVARAKAHYAKTGSEAARRFLRKAEREADRALEIERQIREVSEEVDCE